MALRCVPLYLAIIALLTCACADYCFSLPQLLLLPEVRKPSIIPRVHRSRNIRVRAYGAGASDSNVNEDVSGDAESRREILRKVFGRSPGTGRISGSGDRAKVPSVEKKPDENKSMFPWWAPGVGLLLALAMVFGDDSSGEVGGAYPKNSYYISSSSTVMQYSPGSNGQWRTQVQENNGVWTNIPGLSANRQQALQERDAAEQAQRTNALRIQAARQDMYDNQQRRMDSILEDVFDDMFDDVGRELVFSFGSPFAAYEGGGAYSGFFFS